MHEDTNGVIKSKNRQRQNRKEKKGHTMNYETIHIKL
jgi:ribosomal protein L21